MQFKTNHSPGPWVFDCHDIRDANGHYIIDTDDIQKMSDIKAITQIPTMLEYMMERANCIEKEICLGVCYDPDGSKEELQTILSILKDAGVEVVEK